MLDSKACPTIGEYGGGVHTPSFKDKSMPRWCDIYCYKVCATGVAQSCNSVKRSVAVTVE